MVGRVGPAVGTTEVYGEQPAEKDRSSKAMSPT